MLHLRYNSSIRLAVIASILRNEVAPCEAISTLEKDGSIGRHCERTAQQSCAQRSNLVFDRRYLTSG
jgi:hypothetical protein